MLVKEVMTRSPRVVAPDTKMIEVSAIMCLYRIPGLPVVDNDKLVGIVAEKDVLHRLFPSFEELMSEGISGVDFDRQMANYKQIVHLPAKDLMTPNPITVMPDEHVLKAASVMVRHRFRRIPVAEGGRLVGMLSLGDVHKAIFQTNVSNLAGG